MPEVNKAKKEILKPFYLIGVIIIFTLLVLYLMNYFNLIPKEVYKASDFNIKTIYSRIDYNHDNIDDYSAFVLGARADAQNHPTYKSAYYDTAYPPDNVGVCTDVIWRAFKSAGYSLRDMVSEDIKNNYEQSLTTDPEDIAAWQPGDIVIFRDTKHIGIISDKRNKNGIPYVIHNAGQPNREEDYLLKDEITGHYRFDASLISDDVLKPWQDA